VLGLDRDLVLGAYGSTNILIIIIIIKATKKINMNVFSWEFMGPQLVQLVFLITQRGGKKNEMFGPMYIEAHHIFEEYPHQPNNLNQSYISYTSVIWHNIISFQTSIKE
jgi:hypothetical protein